MCKISLLDSTIKQGVFESILRIMGILTPKNLDMKTSKDGSIFQFFPGESLETQNGKISTKTKPQQMATPERTCKLLYPARINKKILRTLEPGIDSLIDRL